MKTSVNVSSILCGALSVFVLLCLTAPLYKAQQSPCSGRSCNRLPPVTHFYDQYPIGRVSTKKVLDGTNAALVFLGQASNQHGYILPRHSSPIGATQFRETIAAALKAYEISSTYRTLLSTYTGAIEILLGFERDVCGWISSALLPETNFTCTTDNIRHLSQVMKVYETLQGAANEVEVIAPTADEWRGFTAPHYQCAWINSRALNNCSTLPQSSLLMALDQSYHCSDISGNYNLCSNV